MSLMNKGKSQDKIKLLSDSLKSTIAQQGGDFVNAKTTEDLISLESISAPRQSEVTAAFDEVKSQITHLLQGAGIAMEGLDDTGLTAGAVAALAAGNPVAFAEKAYRGAAHAADGVTLVDANSIGAAGSLDYRPTTSFESFDERELREHLPHSIVFNVFGARQDAFGELFYPTTVVTPDQAGLDVSVSRMLVLSEVRRATGKAADFKKKNLIDAAVDVSVLADEATRVVPAKLADLSNAASFIDPDLVAPYYLSVAGVDVPTAPLQMGRTIDIIGESSYAPLIGAGVLDNTDSLDARIVLDAIYLQTNANSPATKFNVSKLPRNAFNKTVEGNYREMNLQFTTADLVIDKNTKAVDGTTPSAGAGTVFTDIASGDYIVRLSVDVNGTANVETGNVKVYASPITVASIMDQAGNQISLTAGAGASIKAALEAMTFQGYELHCNRTNANRRTRGLMLDTTVETERYTIPLGSPLSVPAPTSSNRDAADLKALITASRIRNSNNAVTAMLNYADVLSAHVKGPKRKDVVPQVGGMGRFLVEPFYEYHTLDLVKSVNSTKSHEKAADVSAVLVNAIRDVAYRMYRDSKYQAALEAQTGGTGETPVLAIGTDQVLVRHLMVNGDTRTFGAAFDEFQIVATQDRRMANKIVLSFVRKGDNGPDPLTFGTHAWIPELASSIQVSRGGAQIKETMVQPRTLHVNNLPVMAIIEVQNLSQVLADKIAMATEANDVGNTYFDGLTSPTP